MSAKEAHAGAFANVQLRTAQDRSRSNGSVREVENAQQEKPGGSQCIKDWILGEHL